MRSMRHMRHVRTGNHGFGRYAAGVDARTPHELSLNHGNALARFTQPFGERWTRLPRTDHDGIKMLIHGTSSCLAAESTSPGKIASHHQRMADDVPSHKDDIRLMTWLYRKVTRPRDYMNPLPLSKLWIQESRSTITLARGKVWT
jgi:hypothetical protein